MASQAELSCHADRGAPSQLQFSALHPSEKFRKIFAQLFVSKRSSTAKKRDFWESLGFQELLFVAKRWEIPSAIFQNWK